MDIMESNIYRLYKYAFGQTNKNPKSCCKGTNLMVQWALYSLRYIPFFRRRGR